MKGSGLAHDGTGMAEATWADTEAGTQIHLARHGRAARPSLNGGRAAVATASASRSDAARGEGEARGTVRVGGVHGEAGRANEARGAEPHEEEVKVSERMADVHGEGETGTLKKGDAHGEVVKVIAR